ncbi:MAG: regulatory protein RecX [Desulfobacteraceae bacterium]|nr:regulatory protein RecX [Desulfobacteraceae bacterium]
MSDCSKAYNQAIRFLAPRARSIMETEANLKKKGFDPQVIELTVSTLKQERLLDDREFAALFVENRERFRPKSRFALKYELRQKGISDTIIQEALESVDDFEAARRAVKTKLGQWRHLDRETFKKKMMNYLRNRGFGYEVSISTYRSSLGQDHPPEEYL